MTDKEKLELLKEASSYRNMMDDEIKRSIGASDAKNYFEDFQKSIADINGHSDLRLSSIKQYEAAIADINRHSDPYGLSALASATSHVFAGVGSLPNQSSGSSKPMAKVKAIKINSIKLNNFRFFTDDEQNNTFDKIDGQNVLIYGENGSGKSSFFKAFEFLASNEALKKEFDNNKNIFNKDGETYLRFEFDDETSFEITDSSIDVVDYKKELMESFPHINALSVFKPILDYKHLLRVHYQTDKKKDEINIYETLKELFKDYPLDDGSVLGAIANPNKYFSALDEIINNKLLKTMNSYLAIFDEKFKIEKFIFDMSFADNGTVEPTVHIKMELNDTPIPKYHLFLNEARLTALAISIYFTIIKKVSDLLDGSSLKVLVLDDLLISLDMSNRERLLELLHKYFNEFQIFFFTHDRELFEIFKEKMPWKSFEIYVDDSGEYNKPKLLPSLDYFQKAQKYFGEHDYPACANYLRKEVERLKKKKVKEEKSGIPKDRSYEIIENMLCSDDFEEFIKLTTPNDSVIGNIRKKLIGAKKSLGNSRKPSVETDLKDINSIMRRILHPQSHDDTSKPLYKKELEEAMGVIRNIRVSYDNNI